ncbi:hypothetical protein N657DRAFT_88244 [Parathielavia appendiculata]|uniref:Uncharacterized protein n=1 Tax=Parathielavia appendiculata TaxID=2587402 RepID=A0AAN6Z9J4_9PEZI|nr:hypothetical protein N657DRAFT_88244 [Parathielavia appendiculata]
MQHLFSFPRPITSYAQPAYMCDPFHSCLIMVRMSKYNSRRKRKATNQKEAKSRERDEDPPKVRSEILHPLEDLFCPTPLR